MLKNTKYPARSAPKVGLVESVMLIIQDGSKIMHNLCLVPVEMMKLYRAQISAASQRRNQ